MIQKRLLPFKTATDDEEKTRNQYLLLSKLYVLAEKLLDKTTKHAVLNALSACAQETAFATLPDRDSACALYDGTAESSPARPWLVDMYTQHGTPASLGSMASGYPGEFLEDFAVTMLSARAKPSVHDAVSTKLAHDGPLLISSTKDLTRAEREVKHLRDACLEWKESHSRDVRETNEVRQRLSNAENKVKQLKNQVKQLKR